MMARRLAVAIGLTMAAQDPAAGQMLMTDSGENFSLKPLPRPRLLRSAIDRSHASRARLDRLHLVPVDDRADRLEIQLRREKRHFAGDGDGPGDAGQGIGPRSRMLLFAVEDHVPIGERMQARIGFQGMKISNRGANVTGFGRDGRLRTRDWFLPRAMLDFAPHPDLALDIGYAERLRGFGDTGRSGPLAMAHEDFRALAQRLRPERDSRLKMQAQWRAADGIDLSLTAYRGRIADRLSFRDGTMLPVNSGSATLHGVRISAQQRLSPHWQWGIRYGEAAVAGAARDGERSLSVETGWADGPFRATLRGTRASRPAFAGDASASGRNFRVEAALHYRPAGLPMALSLRRTDPDRLASHAMVSDAPSGAVHAADQAQAWMLGAELRW